jgi:hypothetical protein
MTVALLPGATEDGETEQVGIGAEPTTVQASWTFPEKPCCAVIDRESLPVPPRLTIKLLDARVIEKSGGGLKVAVMDSVALRVISQLCGSVPVHAPLQPPKLDDPEGAAVRETAVPGAKIVEHVDAPRVASFVQNRAPWLPFARLVTDPTPVPARFTLSFIPITKFAVTDAFDVMMIEQLLPFCPEQAPPQLPKREPGSGVAVRLSSVPLTKLPEQVLPQLISLGGVVVAKDTVPVPAPAFTTASV